MVCFTDFSDISFFFIHDVCLTNSNWRSGKKHGRVDGKVR